MIVLDKPKLKFLLGGRAVTVTVLSDRYRRGRMYAVGTAHNKPSTCTATIQRVKVVADGYELEIIQARADQPRLLARNPGAQRRDYVSHPHEAAEGEPEPVDAATVNKMSRAARERDAERQRKRPAEREGMKLHERLRELEARYAAGEASLGSDLRVIRQRIQALQRLNP